MGLLKGKGPLRSAPNININVYPLILWLHLEFFSPLSGSLVCHFAFSSTRSAVSSPAQNPKNELSPGADHPGNLPDIQRSKIGCSICSMVTKAQRSDWLKLPGKRTQVAQRLGTGKKLFMTWSAIAVKLEVSHWQLTVTHY